MKSSIIYFFKGYRSSNYNKFLYYARDYPLRTTHSFNYVQDPISGESNFSQGVRGIHNLVTLIKISTFKIYKKFKEKLRFRKWLIFLMGYH